MNTEYVVRDWLGYTLCVTPSAVDAYYVLRRHVGGTVTLCVDGSPVGLLPVAGAL